MRETTNVTTTKSNSDKGSGQAAEDQPKAKADAQARQRAHEATLMSTGQAARAIVERRLELIDPPSYERREVRRGRPTWEPIEARLAHNLVGSHHDAMGGIMALKAGAELRCGRWVVRRSRRLLGAATA